MKGSEPKYSLTPTDDPKNWIDQNGVSWDSPKDWLLMGVLGGCGCGRSDDIADLAVKVLDTFATPHEERTFKVYEDLAAEIVAHWLDSKDLLEHGSIIGGSWLSDEGKRVHEIIRASTVPPIDTKEG